MTACARLRGEAWETFFGERVQDEGLRDAGRRAPMEGGATGFVFRGPRTTHVSDSDRFAHAEVAGDNARTSKRTRQNPFRCPESDSANRGKPCDYILVGGLRQSFHRQVAVRDY